MRNFNLDDFRKWIDEQGDEDHSQRNSDYSEGDVVKSRIPFKKLVNRIREEDGDRKSICKEFYTYGGTVVSSDSKSLVVEVDSGTFAISKIYVELAD